MAYDINTGGLDLCIFGWLAVVCVVQ